MATLDLAGIITRVCTDLREKFASKSVETSKQDALVSGTNIKTVNGNSLLGSGNISISNADSIGYQLRANRIDMTASDACGPHRLWFTSADGTKMVPINTSKSTSTTAAKTLNTRPIDPFGRITYYAAYGYSDSSLTTHLQWDQYDFSIGYSYVKTLTNRLPIYLKCTPQSDGSAVMADVVQALPTTNDGYIYIFLGVAYSTSGMELLMHHPVYYHDGTGIRLWTGVAANEASVAVETLYDQSGWTVMRCGNIVIVQVHGASCSGSTVTACSYVIPAAYRPAYNASNLIASTSTGVFSRLYVNASTGAISTASVGTTSTNTWYGTLVYAYAS